MLPDFRFVIGAVLATALLAVTSFGLFAAVRLTHQVKVGPLESSRSLVFDDRADWNQFYDPASARRFGELARKSDSPDASAQRAAENPPKASEPTSAAAQFEAHGDDHAGERAAPSPSATSDVAMAPPLVPPSVNLPAAADTAPADMPSETPAVATPDVTNTPVTSAPPADEPKETGALAPAAADQVANAPATTPKIDETKTEATKTEATKIDEAPAPPATPVPAATAAVTVPPVRNVTPRSKAVLREPEETAPVRRAAPPKRRVVRPAQQYAPQPFAQQQQQNWQSQYTPQQRQRQNDPFGQSSGSRPGSQ